MSARQTSDRTFAGTDPQLEQRITTLEEGGGVPGGAVTSVNGKVGAVVLTATDVNAVDEPRVAGIEADVTALDGRVATLETAPTDWQEARVAGIETTNTTQDTRLSTLETTTTDHETRLDAVEARPDADSWDEARVAGIEDDIAGIGTTVGQHTTDLTSLDSRVDTLEAGGGVSGGAVTSVNGRVGAVTGLADLGADGRVLPSQAPASTDTNFTVGGSLDVTGVSTFDSWVMVDGDFGVGSPTIRNDIPYGGLGVQSRTGAASTVVVRGHPTQTAPAHLLDLQDSTGASVFSVDPDGTVTAPGLAVGGAVDSVNGQTGAVVLDAADVGAIPAIEKSAANGVAPLGADGYLPPAQAPDSSPRAFTAANLFTGGTVRADAWITAGTDLGVGPAVRTSVNYGQFGVLSTGSTQPVAVIRAAATQPADLLQLQNNTGTALLRVAADGALTAPNLTATTAGTAPTLNGTTDVQRNGRSLPRGLYYGYWRNQGLIASGLGGLDATQYNTVFTASPVTIPADRVIHINAAIPVMSGDTANMELMVLLLNDGNIVYEDTIFLPTMTRWYRMKVVNYLWYTEAAGDTSTWSVALRRITPASGTYSVRAWVNHPLTFDITDIGPRTAGTFNFTYSAADFAP